VSGEAAPLRRQARPAAGRPEAFPADPDFPQLAVAGDPGLMLEVFRAHLKPVAGPRYHIEDCAPFRFRCRQSTSRCVLQYTLRVVDPATGRRRDQWVTGLVYARAGEAERLWREMQAGDPRREIPSAWLTFEPVDFIPHLQMVVQVFPYDRRLPQLSRVMNGALRRLDPLLLARLGGGRGEWHSTDATVEPTRYRTELGAALKYAIQAHDTLTRRTETLRCYLKVYRNEQGSDTFRLLRSWSERTADGRRPPPYAVVRPIAYVSELRTLALEEAPGASLQQILLQRLDGAGAARAVARAAAAFNQDDVGITRRHTVADQLHDVRLAATLVQWACPNLRARVEAITAAVAAGLEDVRPAPIHADLKPDHIFLSGEQVIFIDLDSVALGDPVRDPAHLVAYVAGRVGLDSVPAARARAWAAAFVAEYFDRVPAPWRKRFALHCAGALLEVASGLFRHQEPRWREQVAAAVVEAERAMSGDLG